MVRKIVLPLSVEMAAREEAEQECWLRGLKKGTKKYNEVYKKTLFETALNSYDSQVPSERGKTLSNPDSKTKSDIYDFLNPTKMGGLFSSKTLPYMNGIEKTLISEDEAVSKMRKLITEISKLYMSTRLNIAVSEMTAPDGRVYMSDLIYRKDAQSDSSGLRKVIFKYATTENNKKIVKSRIVITRTYSSIEAAINRFIYVAVIARFSKTINNIFSHKADIGKIVKVQMKKRNLEDLRSLNLIKNRIVFARDFYEFSENIPNEVNNEMQTLKSQQKDMFFNTSVIQKPKRKNKKKEDKIVSVKTIKKNLLANIDDGEIANIDLFSIGEDDIINSIKLISKKNPSIKYQARIYNMLKNLSSEEMVSLAFPKLTGKERIKTKKRITMAINILALRLS